MTGGSMRSGRSTRATRLPTGLSNASMRVGGGLALAGLVAVLLVANHALSPDPLATTDTSYGQAPSGHGAVYEVLQRLGEPVARARRLPGGPLPGRALWLVGPDFLAQPEADDRPGWTTRAHGDHARAVLAWVEAGGTAVVFGDRASRWQRLGLELGVTSDVDPDVVGPDVHGPSVIAGPEPGQGSGQRSEQTPEPPPTPASSHAAVTAAVYGDPGDEHRLAGAAPLRDRRVQLPRPCLFEPVQGDELRTLLSYRGHPFVVATRVGRGELVAVADTRVLANATLDWADHTLIATDLVRAFGAPVFDERSHGLLPVEGLWDALGTARALAWLAAFGLFAGLGIWALRSQPARTLADDAPARPSLDGFVGALAALYGRRGSRDAPDVLQAYLAGVRHRLRVRLFGRGRGSEAQLARRIAVDLPEGDPTRAVLEGRTRPADRAELLAQARRLEGYLRRVVLSGGGRPSRKGSVAPATHANQATHPRRAGQAAHADHAARTAHERTR